MVTVEKIRDQDLPHCPTIWRAMLKSARENMQIAWIISQLTKKYTLYMVLEILQGMEIPELICS